MVASVDEYLASLPEDRAETLAAVRALVAEYVPAGYEERFQYGMISWVVPLERYPDTYNWQPAALISLGNQKRKMSMYLMGVYGEEATRDRFVERWNEWPHEKRGERGRSCSRRLRDGRRFPRP